MKKRFEEWRKLTGSTKGVPAKVSPIPIRVLDLSGFQELEDKLLLYAPRSGVVPPELSRRIDELAIFTFGVTEGDTRFKIPDEYWALSEGSRERWEIELQYKSHEKRFSTAEATDEEAVAILLALGLDFRDKQGWPLLCTKRFCRQAEAAAKGIMGKMPDRAAAGLESWTKALEKERSTWLAKKKA